MNKVELVAAIADKAGITKADAERALNAFTETVEETLKKGEQIALVGFGTFGIVERCTRRPQSRDRQDDQDPCQEGSEVHGRQGSEGRR